MINSFITDQISTKGNNIINYAYKKRNNTSSTNAHREYRFVRIDRRKKILLMIAKKNQKFVYIYIYTYVSSCIDFFV